MSYKSPILKRYCRDHVPSTAGFGLPDGWSPASTRYSVGQLAVVWGVSRRGVIFSVLAERPRPKPRRAQSEKENAFGVAERRPRTLDVMHSIWRAYREIDMLTPAEKSERSTEKHMQNPLEAQYTSCVGVLPRDNRML